MCPNSIINIYSYSMESYDCIYYVRDKLTLNPWACHLCGIHEKQSKVPMEQYVLPCGHIVHPSCYHAWAKDMVGCPKPSGDSCKLLPKTEENMNCWRCKRWGHSTNHCPIVAFTQRHPFFCDGKERERDRTEYERKRF